MVFNFDEHSNPFQENQPHNNRADSSRTFDIRNFTDRLTPALEKNKYICPVCSHDNLSIDPETGKYKCWNGCECRDIRSAICPRTEVAANRTHYKSPHTAPKLQLPKFKSVPIPSDATLVQLAETATDCPQPIALRHSVKGVPGHATEIVYNYSQNQWVTRYDWEDPNHPKGRNKTCRQWHRKEDGTPSMRKGDKPWLAYRLLEVIAAIKSASSVPAVLLQEGEKVVEIARASGLVSFTFQGSSWSPASIEPSLHQIKDARSDTLIIFLHDGDSAGLKKADTVKECCHKLGLACLLVNPHKICPELENDTDDLEQIRAHMDVPEFIRRLEAEIHAAVDGQNRTLQEDSLYEDVQSASLDSDKWFVASDHPEAFYKPVCQALKLPLENCVTSQTFDGWVYRQKFGGGKGDWRVINSAFYQLDKGTQVWKHQPDNRVLTLIADAGENAFKLHYTKTFGWLVKKPYESNSHKESAFKYVRTRLERPEPLPINTHLLAFHNCAVDLRTGETMPLSKDLFLTNIIPHDYSPNKPCPEVFRQFVVDSFGEDMLEVIRAFTSMFLDPTAPYGRFPHLIGQSGGGKGTLGRFWSSLFGEDGSGSSSHFSDISTPEGRHQYLTGKRIFGFPDVGGYAEGIRAFYELVDNGPMTGRALFNPVAYSLKWYMRFWVASVDHLQVENAGDGWARRAYPIPVKSRTVKPDPFLALQLEAVKADVISWALAMPRIERDLILLSPPESPRAINLALDAALYGDSTKSFVDLCLRPSSKPEFVPSHLLHSWYVAYCKEHGYSPLGMSKFISHLRTVLPRNFVDRHWSPMVNGKRERIQAHWEYLAPVPGAFVKWEPDARNSGENSLPPQNPTWVCLKASCQEGGLMEFEDFWNPPDPPQDDGGGGGNQPNQPSPTTGGGLAVFDVETLEPGHNKGVRPVQAPENGQNHLGQAERAQNQGCPSCPIVQGESFGIVKIQNQSEEIVGSGFSLTPNEVGGQRVDRLDNGQTADCPLAYSPSVDSPAIVSANAENIRIALSEMNWEMISSLTEEWTLKFKKAVWQQLSPEERKSVKMLKNNAQSSTDTASAVPAAPSPRTAAPASTATALTAPKEWQPQVNKSAMYGNELVQVVGFRSSGREFQVQFASLTTRYVKRGCLKPPTG